ncbi:hypothetical protein [Halostagnicola bangensis]
MVRLDESSQSVYRAIVIGVGLYFALLVVGQVLNVALAILAAQVVFGLIAITIGSLLYTQSANPTATIAGASGALIGGGLAQFLWLATGEQVFNLLASILVFLGIGLYIYLVWTSP